MSHTARDSILWEHDRNNVVKYSFSASCAQHGDQILYNLKSKCNLFRYLTRRPSELYCTAAHSSVSQPAFLLTQNDFDYALTTDQKGPRGLDSDSSLVVVKVVVKVIGSKSCGQVHSQTQQTYKTIKQIHGVPRPPQNR